MPEVKIGNMLVYLPAGPDDVCSQWRLISEQVHCFGLFFLNEVNNSIKNGKTPLHAPLVLFAAWQPHLFLAAVQAGLNQNTQTVGGLSLIMQWHDNTTSHIYSHELEDILATWTACEWISVSWKNWAILPDKYMLSYCFFEFWFLACRMIRKCNQNFRGTLGTFCSCE